MDKFLGAVKKRASFRTDMKGLDFALEIQISKLLMSNELRRFLLYINWPWR